MSEILNLQTLPLAAPEHESVLQSTYSGSWECQWHRGDD